MSNSIVASLIVLTTIGWTVAQTEGDIGYEESEYDYYDESALANGPTFDVSMVNVTVVIGQTVMLPCSIEYLGKHKVAWLDQNSFPLTYDDRRVIDDSRFSVVRPSTKEWNLQIREVRSDDEGEYRCTINTNPVRSKIAMLHIRVPPTISDSSKDVVVREGNIVELRCIATGLPEPDITWYKRHDRSNGRPCPISGTPLPLTVDSALRRPVARGRRLTIINATRDCHDIYECEANNGVPPVAIRDVSVTVEFPPRITMPANRMAQSRGRETILECHITAYPHANNFWEKGGRRVVSSGRHRIEAYDDGDNELTLSLRIVEINLNDYGEYQCVANNALGSDKQSIHLFEYISLDGVDSLMDASYPRKSTGQELPMSATTMHFRYDVGKIYDESHQNHHYKIGENANAKLKHAAAAAAVSSIEQQRNTHAQRSQRRDWHQGRDHQVVQSSTSPTISRPDDDQFFQTAEPLQNVTVSPGERAVLKCRVDNLDPRLSVDFNQRTNEWSLIIQDVKPSDGGLYHCQVTSKDDHDSAFEVRLKVKTVYVTGTDYVELGDSIRLVCNATGVSMPFGDLDWYRNGVIVQSEPREGVVVTKKVETRALIAVLFIHPSRQTHSGNYVCRATGDDDSATITVHVINDFLMNRRFDLRGVSAERIMGEHRNSAKSNARQSCSSLHFVAHLLAVYLVTLVTVIMDLAPYHLRSSV